MAKGYKTGGRRKGTPNKLTGRPQVPSALRALIDMIKATQGAAPSGRFPEHRLTDR